MNNVATPQLSTLKDVMCLVNTYLGYTIPLLFSVALVVFIFGIVKYIFVQEKKEEARSLILWGIIGLFVMFSVWGLVNVLVKTFGFNNQLPGVTPGSQSGVSACGGNFTQTGGVDSPSSVLNQTGGVNSPDNLGGYKLDLQDTFYRP
ncbi:MAG: pilin [Patescibacteria group bacterium]|nr:pilin [Patescibacteria group bacterium]